MFWSACGPLYIMSLLPSHESMTMSYLVQLVMSSHQLLAGCTAAAVKAAPLLMFVANLVTPLAPAYRLTRPVPFTRW